ncbi:MAG: PolC-type DNA polymerase III [Clostridiales Family XIII bacterium]|nr:PolC-type DNA polymerase III [Clostridiales Family XIII bacterium]
MEKLIERTLDWGAIAGRPREEYRFCVEGASVSDRTGTLTVRLRLNFIIPYGDMDALCGQIRESVAGLASVRFQCVYDNVILARDEIVRLFSPYAAAMAKERFGDLLAGGFSGGPDGLVFAARGAAAADRLSSEASAWISGLFEENFGEAVQVSFDGGGEAVAGAMAPAAAESADPAAPVAAEAGAPAEAAGVGAQAETAAAGAQAVPEAAEAGAPAEAAGAGAQAETAAAGAQAVPAMAEAATVAPAIVAKAQAAQAAYAASEDPAAPAAAGPVAQARSVPKAAGRPGAGESVSAAKAPATAASAKTAARGKAAYEKGAVVHGKAIKENSKITALSSIEEGKKAVVEGLIFSVSTREVFDGEKKMLASLLITDNHSSACVKMLVPPKSWEKMEESLAKGTMIRVSGTVATDFYDHELIIRANHIEKLKLRQRQDLSERKRVELHAHTKMSALDGLAEVSELVKLAARFKHSAVAITDHGVAQAFPEAAAAGKKAGIKVIFGLEGYLYDDGSYDKALAAVGSTAGPVAASGGQASASEHTAAGSDAAAGQAAQAIDYAGCHDRAAYKSGPVNHIIILARNQAGLKNLYKLVSYSHIDYFYKKPRIPKSLLAELRDGLIIGSACEAGQVYQAVRNGVPAEDIDRIAGFYDYLEIQPLINNQFLVENGYVRDVEELKNINIAIVQLGRRLSKPVAATCDSHYLEQHEAVYRKILMGGQGYKDIEGDKGLYFRTTDEMLQEFAYLGEAAARDVVIEAPCAIADMIDELSPVPSGKFPPKIADSDRILRDGCMENAWAVYGKPLPGPIHDRLERELNSIISNKYAVMYVSAQKLVQKSLEDGYLVGSRGSVGSSFAATMAGITEVNPLPPHYICNNGGCRYLEWGDADSYSCGADMPAKQCPQCGAVLRQDGFNIPFETFLGFEGNKEPDIDLNFAGEYQPSAHKYVEELFGKNNVFRAGTIGTIKSKTAYGFVRKYFEERSLPVNKWEIERLTAACTDVRRTTGQHPGGIIILPEGHEIYEFCPVQHPANDAASGIVTTHFDYHSIDENLLKLDILGHDVPSLIRHLQDLTGVDPLSVPLNDSKVNSIFNGVEGLDIQDRKYAFKHGTYGIPEFGTRFVRQMLDDTRPRNLSDLVRISGFSHGTDVWVNNAQDLIKSGTASLKEAISTRDDIMNYLIGKGVPDMDSFKIMEKVRKGKGVNEEEAELMRRSNVPDWYIESCRRIKYMFPKAHAVAYVLMSYRIAYYKVYYPLAFYAVYFTARVADFDVAAAMAGPQGALQKIRGIESRGKNATNKEQEEGIVMEVLYEMFARGYSLLPPDVGHSDAVRFLVEGGQLRIPLAALQGVGENAARSVKEAFDEAAFISVNDMKARSKINKTAAEALAASGALGGIPESNQISMFGL